VEEAVFVHEGDGLQQLEHDARHLCLGQWLLSLLAESDELGCKEGRMVW
jgi:hypothetical protein